MNKITPHLWFDTQAVEATRFYTSTFPDSRITNTSVIYDTPSGDCDVVAFELFEQPFMAISAGPFFQFTPAVSFAVACKSKDEVDEYWAALSEGGKALMPLDSYPFSERYGWTEDRYGLSWQIMYVGEQVGQRITPTIMYVGDVCGKAEEAIKAYASVFPNSTVGDILRYGADDEPDREGTVKYASFSLDGQEFAAMDSAQMHDFTFNESISFMVACDTQEEIDRYWDALSAVPEAEQCGWLKDKYGLSWQVVPSALEKIMGSGSKEENARVTRAFLQMKKFDLAELERARQGSEVNIGGQK